MTDSDSNANKTMDLLFLENLLNTLKSDDAYACLSALIALREASEQGITIYMYFRITTLLDPSFLDSFSKTDELILALIKFCEYKESPAMQVSHISKIFVTTTRLKL